MKLITSRKIRVAIGSAVASALLTSAAVSFADDTEIFFGGPSIDQGIRPNVLFILDNSGSMNWHTSSNANPSPGEQSRIQILKDSFSNVISSAGAINAGIMVLNERAAYNNTRMVYPISYINDPLPSSVQQLAGAPQIIDSGDDATQSSNDGVADINDAALVMGRVTTSTITPGLATSTLADLDAFFLLTKSSVDYSCRLNKPSGTRNNCTNSSQNNINIRSATGTNYQTALLYFRGFNLPAATASTISSAYIEILPTNTQSTPPTVKVTLENSKTAVSMNDDSPLGARTYQPSVNVAASVWKSTQKTQLDITQQVKNLLAAAPATNPLNSVLLSLRAVGNSTTDYTFCARNCGTTLGVSNAPRLIINYSTTSTATEDRTGALRFQNVSIPQGATITSATLNFAPAADNSSPVTFQIQAEKTGNASIFTTSTDVTSRTKTSAQTTWAAPSWATQNPAQFEAGPDVTTQVQEVVSSSSWCGNNAMAFYLKPTAGTGTRTSFSVDGSPGLQPTLTVNYTGGTGGCLNPIIEATVTTAKNDAYQNSSGTVILDGLTLPVASNLYAARYLGVPIKQGASILDAQVILTPANTVSGANVTSSVGFENVDSSPDFAASSNNLSGRSRTSTSNCIINNWTTGNPFTCKGSGITSALQSVINRAGWKSSNALSVIVSQSNSTLQTQAYETNPAQTVKLRIKVASGGLADSTYTVRQHLDALVQAMDAGNGTPIVPTYYEAAQYLRGQRSGYPSPITSACQPTHVVLLTDGQANGTTTTAQNGIKSWATSCTVPVKTTTPLAATDTGSTISDEQCGRTLAEWMGVTDQSTLDGDSFVNMDTIGFALDALGTSSATPKNFLSDLARNGKGGAYNASNATELSAAFSDILQKVQSVDTTFVSASAPVNSFERQNNKDELYFSLFRPQESNRWPGNLKRYRFAAFDSSGNLNPQIVDVDNVAAVDTSTGGFKATAKSFWSNVTDGNFTEKGGAASKLISPASRKLFTYIGTTSPTFAAPATLSGSPLDTSNTNITNAMLSNAANTTEREAQFNYIRGLDPANTAIERQALGDPIHSSPRLATYSCITPNAQDATKCDLADQTALIGTNEGFLQAFDTQTGEELFGYMPQELLVNIKKLMDNSKSTSLAPRPYGMDNPVTLWVNDVNNDGKILNLPSSSSPQAGEFVYAYATMGRGGRNIYALDVTNRSNPKLLWYINGGVSPGFANLGQTWSAPVKTKIKIGTTITDVLIFSGGYDSLQDDTSNLNVANRGADTMGNALYIVDAKTGSLIWSASSQASNPSATQGHKSLSKMIYSIPSNVRVIDLQTAPSGTLVSDPDKLADQFFVGDMGGQVWRFYINNGSTGSGLITPGGTSSDGVFATSVPANFSTLSTTAKLQNQRRFYNEPDVALLNKDGKLSLSINIGSGYRGHPLKTETQDIFYSFRTSNLTNPAGAEGTLTAADLLDLTSNLTPTTLQQQTLNPSGSLVKGGWYLRMPSTGEKVLTRALTSGALSTVYFNTYEPAANSNSCEASYGTSRGYAVSLYDATPIETANGTPTASDRYSELEVPGIPPQPEQICIGDHCFVIKGPSDIDPIKMPKLGKMYWIDKTEIE